MGGGRIVGGNAAVTGGRLPPLLLLFLFALTTGRQIYIVRPGEASSLNLGWAFGLPSALAVAWGVPGLRFFQQKTAPRSIGYHEVSIGTHFVRSGIAERLLGMESDGVPNPGRRGA